MCCYLFLFSIRFYVILFVLSDFIWFYMCLSVFICLYLLLSVFICFHLFLLVFICFCLFLYVFICFYLFLQREDELTRIPHPAFSMLYYFPSTTVKVLPLLSLQRNS